MTTNNKILLAMVVVTILGAFLWGVVIHSRTYGPTVGATAIGILYAWIMWRFVKMLDAEQARKIAAERAVYESRKA